MMTGQRPTAFVSASLPWRTSTRSSATTSSVCRTIRMCEAEEAQTEGESNAQTQTQTQMKTPQTTRDVKPAPPAKSGATWANEVFPGFKSKGTGSRPLGDLRPKSFRKDEEGYGVCDNCKGSGLMTCSFCEGVDFINDDGTIAPCPACSGKKDVTCAVCFGTTKEVELTGNWWDRGLAALFGQ